MLVLYANILQFSLITLIQFFWEIHADLGAIIKALIKEFGGELREIEQGEWVGVKNKGRLRADWELGNKDCIVVNILTEDTWQKHYSTYTKWEQ